MKSYIKLVYCFVLLAAACSADPTATPTPAPKKDLTFKNTVVSLTFDDGDADNYTVRETLSKNDLHATFYIVSGLTGTQGFMTEEELRGLYADGNEIGGHTLDHSKLTDLDNAAMRREICQDRQNLLERGYQVTSFAYPYGSYNDQARQTVQDCGYTSARIVVNGPETLPPGDPFLLQAMPYIVSDTRLPKMIRYVTQVEKDGGGWVIFVFHHVCDGCDKFAVSPQVFSQFADWLHEQRSAGLVVKTVAEVIGGSVQPGVSP